MLGAAGADGVQVSGAWARATAPLQDEGAVYLSMRSAAGDRLLSVSSPDAAQAMLHQTTEMNGMSGMSDMAAVDVPAGGSVSLAPHGRHIMLMGLKHPLVAGQRVTVDLHFAKAGEVELAVPVQPIGEAGPPGAAP